MINDAIIMVIKLILLYYLIHHKDFLEWGYIVLIGGFNLCFET